MAIWREHIYRDRLQKGLFQYFKVLNIFRIMFKNYFIVDDRLSAQFVDKNVLNFYLFFN